MRDAAIQKLSQALTRLTRDGAAVRIHPRCRRFIDGLEAGYVWDERSIANSISPNTRRPRKDGMYDHLQNCAEYTWLNYGPVQFGEKDAERVERRIARRSNVLRRDRDQDDPRPRGGYQRGGYA